MPPSHSPLPPELSPQMLQAFSQMGAHGLLPAACLLLHSFWAKRVDNMLTDVLRQCVHWYLLNWDLLEDSQST